MNRDEIVVPLADLRVGTGDDVLVVVGLGSCVAVVLHDPGARVGGLAHVLLPAPAGGPWGRPGRSPATAVPRLLELMAERGASLPRVTARLVGGASMFAGLAPPGTIQVGERNLIAARRALGEAGLPLVGEAVGGDYGRTVRFRVADGRLEVTSVRHGAGTL